MTRRSPRLFLLSAQIGRIVVSQSFDLAEIKFLGKLEL